MKLKTKSVYNILVFLFIILSFVEIIDYFFLNTDLFMLLNCIINLVIIVLLILLLSDYKNKADVKKRVVLIFLVVCFGLFNSLFLEEMIKNLTGYTNFFIKKDQLYLTIKAIKITMYVLFLVVGAFDVNDLIKLVNKAKKGKIYNIGRINSRKK